jgi:Trm5-related predicted tRNA methylase
MAMRFTTRNLIGLVVALGAVSACTDRAAKLRADIGKTACHATTREPIGTIVEVERDPSGRTSAIAYVVERDGDRRRVPPSLVQATVGACQ